MKTQMTKPWACWLLRMDGKVIRLTMHAAEAEAEGALTGHKANLAGNRNVADLWVDRAEVDVDVEIR